MNHDTLQTVNLSNDTYIVIDREQGFVSINRGQRMGTEQDWGGQAIAFLTIEQAEAIASVLYVPFQQPAEYYRDAAQPAEMRDDYVGA